MKKTKVSIIIVHYKVKRKLVLCLKSIEKNKPKFSFEVIVVDNGEKEPVGEELKNKFSWVSYIKCKNLGFGAGNNLGVKSAKGKYLLFLNPDTEVLPGSIDVLTKFLEKEKRAGIVAPLLLDKHNKIRELQGSAKLSPLSAIFSLSFINKIIPANPFAKSYFLKDWNKRSLKEVDVVPGSCTLVRRDVFEQVGGFDESFFLYFEESDFCKRVKELGWKIFINPKGSVIHYGGASTNMEKKVKIEKIFRESRRLYFRKHYGMFWSLLVEFFTRLSRSHLIIFLIFCLSLTLRFFKIGTYLNFIGDYGWYYLSARDFLTNGNIPLVGISSSVPVFKQGAVFTWFLSLVLVIGKFNPLAGAIFTTLLGVINVLLVYIVIKNLYSGRIAIISSIITASSPLIVVNDRVPFVTSLIFPTSLIFVWMVGKIYRKENYYVLLGFLFSFLYQIELVGSVLIAVFFISLIWNRFMLKKKYLALLITGFLIGLIPFIVWDIKSGVYLQTFGFFIWTLTKIYEGLLKQINFSIIPAFSDYLSRFIFPFSKSFSLAFFLMSFFYFLVSLIKKSSKVKFFERFIISYFLIFPLAFSLRGTISDAYIPFLFSPLILMIPIFLERIIRKNPKFGWIFTAFLVGLNTIYLFKMNFFFYKYPKFSERLETSEKIIKDADGKNYELTYVGPNDMFEAGDNHWRYLLWWKGNEPKERSNLEYIIYEFEDPQIKGALLIDESENIKLLKRQK